MGIPAALPRRIAPLFFFLVCTMAEAGSVPAASSIVPGVVLGSFSSAGAEGLQAFFGAEHPDEFVERFRQACARRQRIWALGAPQTVVCSRLEYVPEGGNGAVYALHLQSEAPLSQQASATVLSLRPIAQIEPAGRKLTQAEIQAVGAVYRSAHLRQAVQRAIANDAVRVLDFDRKRSSIYLVEWKRLDDGAGSSNDYYLVINRTGGRFRSAGHFEGEIVRFLDVDNDGRPDVQRSINCDGMCEAVTSMYGGVRDIVSIYNH